MSRSVFLFIIFITTLYGCKLSQTATISSVVEAKIDLKNVSQYQKVEDVRIFTNHLLSEAGFKEQFTEAEFQSYLRQYLYFAMRQEFAGQHIALFEKGYLQSLPDITIEKEINEALFNGYPLVIENQKTNYGQYVAGMCNAYLGVLNTDQFEAYFADDSDVQLIPKEDIEVKQMVPTGTPVLANLASSGSASNDYWGFINQALSVKLRLSRANVAFWSRYFSTGFGEDVIRTRLESLLGDKKERWIAVESIFPNWLSKKTNKYSQDFNTHQSFGAAWSFFQNDYLASASAECLESRVIDSYRPVSSDEFPKFGDLLYTNGHSSRVLLRNPHNNKLITLSLHAGGAAAYRLWYADDDGFMKKPVIWRRCKAGEKNICPHKWPLSDT